MAEIKLTKDNFDSIVSGDKPVLIDFFATWCGPCKMLAPIIAEIAEEKEGTLVVAKADVDEEIELANKFGVSSIPTVVLVKDGAEVDRFVGFRPKEAIEDFVG
jgi:thioredoxin 1